MLDGLKRAIIRAQFQPGWLALFVNPFYFARAGLFEHLKELAGQMHGELLDVGCGSKPYVTLFPVSRYVGLEIDTPETRQFKRADAYYDGHRFPFETGRFDSVFASEVLEHVFNPDEFLAEAARVLKPGGQLLLTVPFVWDEHEQPYDYARYSSFGLIHLLSRHGFETVLHRRSNADVRVLFQLINAYIYKTLPVRQRHARLLLLSLLTAPVNLTGLLLYRLLPRNDDLYLDNVVLARRKADGD